MLVGGSLGGPEYVKDSGCWWRGGGAVIKQQCEVERRRQEQGCRRRQAQLKRVAGRQARGKVIMWLSTSR